MARDLILWLAGVPLIVIIRLHLFGVGFIHDCDLAFGQKDCYRHSTSPSSS